MVEFCNDANQVNFSGLVSSMEFYNKVYVSMCIRGSELCGVGYMDTSGKLDRQLHLMPWREVIPKENSMNAECVLATVDVTYLLVEFWISSGICRCDRVAQ